jgi:mannose-6-phosphate isomerase-like protein (cupin superfamily)
MADYTAKRIGDMQANYGGGFVKVRAELGVTSFGMQVIQMPPDYADYPDHDHADSGQEEVYLVLSGSGSMEIDGERVEMNPETLIRVAADTKRKVYAGPQGLRMAVIGGCPGEAYKIAEGTQLEAV